MVIWPRMVTLTWLARLLLSWLLLGYGALALAPSWAATPTPNRPFELDRQTLALGEALTLRISRALSDPSAPLDTLDLRPLQQDFDLLERTLGRDDSQENLLLTLYPRRIGRLTLPTLGQAGQAGQAGQMGKAASGAVTVTVTEGSDSVPKVFWKISLDPAEPLARQASTLTLEACDDGSLLWQRPTLPAAQGLLVRPVNETEIITQRNGERCTAHRWHWAVLPTAAGPASVKVPVMQASKFGNRLRFTPPTLAVTTQALPDWVPDEVAVGKPDISADPLPAQAVLNQPLAWRLRITGNYSAQDLQTLLRLQFQSSNDDALTAYAPRIERQASQTLDTQHLVTVYLLPHARGPWQVPALQLPWFDPKTAQLQQIRIEGGQLEVIDPVRQRWLWAMAALAGVGAAIGLGFWLWRRLRWRWRRHITLKKLRQCHTPEALCQTLLPFAWQGHAQPAPTLRTWQTHMQQQCQSVGLDELVGTLERCRFSQAKDSQPTDPLMLLACAWMKSAVPLSKNAMF